MWSRLKLWIASWLCPLRVPVVVSMLDCPGQEEVQA